MIKCGGYVLGEFGHHIAHKRDTSAEEQFALLRDKFVSCEQVRRGGWVGGWGREEGGREEGGRGGMEGGREGRRDGERQGQSRTSATSSSRASRCDGGGGREGREPGAPSGLRQTEARPALLYACRLGPSLSGRRLTRVTRILQSEKRVILLSAGD